jgi:hypothetical protein
VISAVELRVDERAPCPERTRLADVATEAIKGLCVAKENLEAAKQADPLLTTTLDLAALFLALTTAIKIEAEAVEDLRRHKKMHGC